MMDIPKESIKDGVVIPEYYAELWGIGVGDNIKINEVNMIVSAIVPQHVGLMLFTGYEYLNSVTGDIPPVYNTIYGRCEQWESLEAYLKENDAVYTSLEDDKTGFDTIMESMSVLIWFMIACSVILGITVLYSVGLINLSAREYEYMFMGVMGYSHKSIMAAHIKETAVQWMLSLPIGFLLGNLLLAGIKDEFSGNSFAIADMIYPKSYFISALSVAGVTALMAFVTSRSIGKLDIVEGLKSQEESS